MVQLSPSRVRLQEVCVHFQNQSCKLLDKLRENKATVSKNSIACMDGIIVKAWALWR